MPKIVDAVVDKHGQIRRFEPLMLHSPQRVLVNAEVFIILWLVDEAPVDILGVFHAWRMHRA